jgi:hypothetical protein
MLESLTLESFLPLVGTTFRLDVPGVTLDLVLSEATALAPRPSGRRPFTLLFHEPACRLVPQATYPLDHPHLGRVELFIVPLGPDPSGMGYEAVFG